MPRSKLDPWLIPGVLGGFCYPFLVYFALGRIPPALLILTGLALFLLRMRKLGRIALPQPVCIAIALAGLLLPALWRPELAARAYPVVVSLTMAAVFAFSLIRPPSAVEVIARIGEPDLPPAGVAYTRRVTQVWTVFLLVNAGISTATALWGSLALWTLWNGCLSYLAMGTLFAAEYMVRRRVRTGQGLR